MIGASIKRKEDPRLITGQGKFTDDVHPRDAVYMAVLRSPHAHARILSVDTSLAKEHPGVVAVMTGAEVNARCLATFRLFGVRDGMNARSRWPMAGDVARYLGEPVTAVVASSLGDAWDATELIDVAYEALPAAVDMEQAMESGAPLVHSDFNTNVAVHASNEAGDVAKAFQEAHGVVKVRLVEPRLVPNSMEGRAVVADYHGGTGDLEIWVSTQSPHFERDNVAVMLGIPHSRVRIYSQDVGGGFGAKVDTYSESIIASILSKDVRRPVKWVEERREHFTTTVHGRGEVQYVEGAYDADGMLTGLKVDYYTDMGSYCRGPSQSVVGGLTPLGIAGAYQVRNVAWNSYGIYTNKVPVGPYRGYGQHASSYVVERVMDLIAGELGLDPAEVRRRNLVPADSLPYRAPTGLVYDSGDYHATLEKALGVADYAGLRERQRQARERGELVGIGLATTVDASGFGPSGGLTPRPSFESAFLRVETSGKMTVATGSSPHGQGLETSFAQIVADEMGVSVNDVEVIYGDTHVVPPGVGTFASRSLVVGGTALLNASRQVKERALQIAAELLRTDPEHVVLEGGTFVAEDIPSREVTWADVGAHAYGVRTMVSDMERGLEATCYWEPPGYTFPFCANVALVSIDPATGRVTLEKYVAVDDCGVVVNPMIVEGQVHGGLAQGIGPALMEEALWDEQGQMLTGTFLDYAMPTAEDLPSFILDSTVSPSPHNPIGAKGMGESPTISSAATIMNAVADALSPLGVTDITMPAKEEKVWRVIQERGVF
jgi:carbon-monoxide dehydrogenase large subunit